MQNDQHNNWYYALILKWNAIHPHLNVVNLETSHSHRRSPCEAVAWLQRQIFIILIQHIDIEMSDLQYQDSSQSYRCYIEGRYLVFFLDVVCSMRVQLLTYNNITQYNS